MKLVGTADSASPSATETRASVTRSRPAVLDVRSSSPVIDLRDTPTVAAPESFSFDHGLFVDLCAPKQVESEMLRILRGDLAPRHRSVPPPGHRRP